MGCVPRLQPLMTMRTSSVKRKQKVSLIFFHQKGKYRPQLHHAACEQQCRLKKKTHGCYRFFPKSKLTKVTNK